MRKSPLAVSVGAAPPQPLHPPAEGHVLRRAAAAVRDGQRAVVQRRGGQEIQVQGGTATRGFFFCVHLTGDSFRRVAAVVCCSPRAVSRLSPLNGETVAAGVVTCLIVYPLYLLVFTLFRMSRSKVTQNLKLLRRYF